MPLLNAAFKGRIKTLARKCGLLGPINTTEYWYANRISSSSLSFYRSFISQDSVVFDIGAHRGLKSRLFLELGAKVVAVEPMPYCAIHLREMVSQFRNLTVFEGACADRIGTSQLHLCSIHPQNSTLCKEFRDEVEGVNTDGWKTITIETTTLDDLIARHGVPVFCKIDTEGFEDHVLAGLNQKIANLSFEYSLQRCEKLVNCLHRLDSLGFKEFNYITGRTPRLQLTNWLPINEFLDHLQMQAVSEEGDVLAR